MVLLRRVIGDALRTRRQAQHRTLREVSTAANVSLGYLSEIERGQKEPSSELLSAICEALGAHLSEVLRDVSHTVEHAERGSENGAAPARVPSAAPAQAASARATASDQLAPTAQVSAVRSARPRVTTTIDGDVSVTVLQQSPLKATLRATRNTRHSRDDVLTPA